jgi:hypothetical protein
MLYFTLKNVLLRHEASLISAENKQLHIKFLLPLWRNQDDAHVYSTKSNSEVPIKRFPFLTNQLS